MHTVRHTRKSSPRPGLRAVLLMLALLLLPCPATAKTSFSDDPDAIQRAAGSVMFLEVTDEKGAAFATGSGFILFDEHTLVTNYHVIEGAFSLYVTDEAGNSYDFSEVLIADKAKDLAILRAPAATGLTPLKPGTATPRRGEKVVAIGSPKGFMNLVSLGNVSDFGPVNGTGTVLFTAPISPGSSGGALFNDKGEVIGVTSGEYYPGQANDIYYAVGIGEVLALYARWDGESVCSVPEHAKARADDEALYATPSPSPFVPTPVPTTPTPHPKGTRIPTLEPTPRGLPLSSGSVLLVPDFICSSRLTVTPRRDTNCYVYLRYMGQSGQPGAELKLKRGVSGAVRTDMSFYMCAGETKATVSVPPGRYKVYLVTGSAFFGSADLFGDESRFYVCISNRYPDTGKELVLDLGGVNMELVLEQPDDGDLLLRELDRASFPG